MARGCPAAGAAVAEVPGVGEACGLNGRAHIRRAGRVSSAGDPRFAEGASDKLAVGATSLTVTTTELLLVSLLASVTVSCRRVAARIRIGMRGVQAARLIRPVAKVPGVGERSGAATLRRLAERQGRLGVDRHGRTRIDHRRAEDLDCPGGCPRLAVLVLRRHRHGVSPGGRERMARGCAGAGAAVAELTSCFQ